MDPVGFLLSTAEIHPPWDGGSAPGLLLPPGPDAASPSLAHPCCPFCGNKPRARSAVEEQRRQLNSLLTNAYLYAVVPQVSNSENKTGSTQIEVPWARTGSEFTLMFEALVMALIRRIPVKTAATILGTGDARLWRLVDREPGKGLFEQCAAGSPVLERRSGKKGRDLLNLFYDLDVSFDTQIEPRSSSAFTGELEVVRETGRIPGTGSLEPSKALILAAITKLISAMALTHQHFRIARVLNNALGMVSAEEGMIAPGRSRAPPQAN